MSDVVRWLREHRESNLEKLFDFLRIPSISTDPAFREKIDEAAGWMANRLKEAGCTKVEVIPTKGHPLVYGEWMGAPGKPTVLVYGHYDVQPADPVELWQSPPFEPMIRNGKIYARGACDDKGQVVIHPNALEAHLRATGTCPVNVKFIIEGEEEIGSPSLEPFLRAERKRLACDAVVVSDTGMFSKKTPSITTSLRGLTYLEVEVYGTKRDLHSGSFGGAVINPANALAAMIAQLKDKRGKIRVPGFYDDVRPLSRAQRKQYAQLPFDEEKFRRSIGAPALWGEKGYTVLERLWARPTLDVNGIWSGYIGEGAKTVIPAVAHAKISMRLVADQDPKDIARKVTAYLKEIAPPAVRVKVKTLHGGDAWSADTSHPVYAAASRAVERSFGKAPVFAGEGGSIPIVAAFAKRLRAPVVLLGIGLPDDAIHAPNEKLDLDQFHKGSEAAALFLEELGRQG